MGRRNDRKIEANRLPVAPWSQFLGRAGRFARDALTIYDPEVQRMANVSKMEGGSFSKCGSRMSAAHT
eukprot:8335483-Pyramimonas_sp.AAC.1